VNLTDPAGACVFSDGYSAAACEWCGCVTEALRDRVAKCMACGRWLDERRGKPQKPITVTAVDVVRGIVTFDGGDQ